MALQDQGGEQTFLRVLGTSSSSSELPFPKPSTITPSTSPGALNVASSTALFASGTKCRVATLRHTCSSTSSSREPTALGGRRTSCQSTLMSKLTAVVSGGKF